MRIFSLKLVFIFVAINFIACCQSRSKNQYNQDLDYISNSYLESFKPFKKFDSKMKSFNMDFADKILLREQKTKKNYPILLIFVDSLRKDYADLEMPFLNKEILQSKEGWMDLRGGLSSSTVTHFSTYSLYYGDSAFFRDSTLTSSWNKGSPFLNILKQSGYQINNYGSPWQSCFNYERMFNQGPKELVWSGAANVQLVFSQNPKSFTNFCFESEPDVPVYFSKIPKTLKKGSETLPLEGVNPYDLLVQHQGYQDYYVYKKFLEDFQSGKITDKTFTQLYFFSTHMGFAWPEYGLPNEDWSSFSFTKEFNVYSPYYSWTSDESKYHVFTNPKEELVNSYKNAVRYIDFLMESLLTELKKSLEWDDMILIFLSDHGEKINDPEVKLIDGSVIEVPPGGSHCCTPVPSNYHVPIYIKVPKELISRVEAVKKHLPRHYDIFPTILDMLGYSHSKDLEALTIGESLFKRNRGQCNITVSPKGKQVPRVFIFSNGQKSLYMMLDSENTLNAQGAYFLRETSAKDITEIYYEFKKSDEKSGVLDRYLNDPDYSECFRDLLGT